MPELSYSIKFQMANLGKQIQDTASKMKPIQMPVQSGSGPNSEYLTHVSTPKSKPKMEQSIDELFTSIARTFRPKKSATLFQRIMQGAVERTENSFGAVKDSWSRFNAELSDSSSISDAMGAFRGLGDGVIKSFTTMAKPIAGWILLAAGLTKVLTDAAKELEDSQNRLNQAFKSGGRMKGVSAEKYNGIYSFSEDQNLQGNINQAGFLNSMARVRSSALSLDEKTFDKAMQQSIDLGAYLGVDKGEALEQYAEILNGLNFTYEDGIKLGTSFTRSEISMIDALKQAGSQAEANAIIMRKVAQQTKGAQEEYMSTLSGKWEQFWNLLGSSLQDLGKILMPIVKVLLDGVNLLLRIFKFATKILADGFGMLFKKVGTFLKDWTGYDFGLGANKEENGENQNGNENWIDPRRQLSVNFESATSMASRIQKSILERQSPQVKMVDLLTKINEKVDGIGNGQKKTADINEQQVSETRVTNTTLRNQNLGLQYG